jgi:IPT/TIG domain
MRTLLLRSNRNGNLKRSKSCQPRLESMEPRTLLSAVNWTGAGGDNNWDTAANWSTNLVPGSGADVTINIAANVVHSNNVTDSINSLTSTEPLTISGGTLSIAAPSTIGSTLSITGGTLTGTGDVTVTGLVTLNAGTLSGASALNADGGMLINLNSSIYISYFYLQGRTINNAAGQTATLTSSNGDIEASNGSVFNNRGTFVVDGLGYYGDSGTGDPSSFVNQGSFNVSENVGGISFGAAFYTQGGSFDIKAGSGLELDGGGSSIGSTFAIESDGDLSFGIPYTLDSTTTIGGTGDLFTYYGDLQVISQSYTFAGTVIERQSLQVDGSLAAAAVQVGGGTLSGVGRVGSISTGSGSVSPGDSAGAGILHVVGDVSLLGDDDGPIVPAHLRVVLNGPTAGIGYSQLSVGGSVDLRYCDLDASLGFTPVNGESFTIIKSSKPIDGTFEGLPEGASLTLGNTPFTITYAGGEGHDVVLTQAIAVAPRPVITGLSPSSGPASGGTLVTITGVGFTHAIGVEFGTSAASFTVVSDTTITAESPAGTGTVDVSVDFREYKTPQTTADLFLYKNVAVAPKVTGISPSSGLSAGGTLVTITGTGFTGATKVDFGKTPASGLVVQNDTTIIVHSPAGTGVAHVTVITPDGTSATSSADLFTYTAPVTVIAAPRVISLARFGFHMQPTSIVLTFNSALDPSMAEYVNNYHIVTMGGRGRNAALVDHVTRVTSAIYNPATLTVTLHTAQRLDVHNRYRLTVNGATPRGLKGATGVPLVGRAGGAAATSYVAIITGKLLAGPSPRAPIAALKRLAAHHRLTDGPKPSAVDALSVLGHFNADPPAVAGRSSRTRISV